MNCVIYLVLYMHMLAIVASYERTTDGLEEKLLNECNLERKNIFLK